MHNVISCKNFSAVELLKHNIEKERVLEESIDDVLAEMYVYIY